MVNLFCSSFENVHFGYLAAAPNPNELLQASKASYLKAHQGFFPEDATRKPVRKYRGSKNNRRLRLSTVLSA